MVVLLTYRCRSCGVLATLAHESDAPTLGAAMWNIVYLRTIPGAGVIETHDCGGGVVGLMDLIHGEGAGASPDDAKDTQSL